MLINQARDAPYDLASDDCSRRHRELAQSERSPIDIADRARQFDRIEMFRMLEDSPRRRIVEVDLDAFHELKGRTTILSLDPERSAAGMLQSPDDAANAKWPI